MNEQSTASPQLSEALAAGYKIIFGWMNTHPRGELTSSDFTYFQKNYGLGPAVMSSILRALTEKKYLEQVEKATRYRQGKDVVYVAGEQDVWALGELAFEFAYQNEMILSSSQNVPASDRFVSIDHNSADIQQAISNLVKIEKRVEESNELIASKEERLSIIREVSGLRELLNEPVVRIASVWVASKGRGILVTIATHWGDSLLSALADQTLKILSKYFGFGN